ncbi:MAG TPA: TonB-dependent receptor plug domain-containing protein [Gemmatimonadaceae bacterium]|nr:TonB-dependent receptor plug domain-containing protein [Gemmatimonadaceae bacterium]
MSPPRSPRAAAALLTLAIAAGGAACHRSQPAREPVPRDPAPREVDIGYGTADRSSVTGAIASVDGADTRRINARSVAEMLQDRFPGVEVLPQPNGNVSIRIRGRRSFLASSEPLFVVDGTPLHNVGGTLQDINPQDIERIDILKDAGSTAVYGSRGANGVVLITTRRAPR